MTRRLKVVVFLLVLLLSVLVTKTAFAAAEGEPNDSYTTATSIPINTDAYGNLDDQYDYDWYQFQLTQPGSLLLSFTHQINTTSTANYYTVRLYTESQEFICKMDVKGSTPSTALPAIGLPAGTYLVGIESSSYSVWSPAQYSVKAGFTASVNWESEFNDQYGTADPVNLNTTYSGTLMDSGDDDWYQFTVTQPGSVRLRFSHNVNTTSNSMYYTVTLYDEKQECLAEMDVKGSAPSVELPVVGLPAGTYFARVEDYYSSTWSPAQYSFKVEFTASSYWEKEFNDGYGTANSIALNNAYSGTLMDAYDYDWYQFKLTQPGCVRLNFSHGIKTTSDSLYYLISLYDANRDTLTRMTVKGSTPGTALPVVGLPAGTYYVEIDSYSVWSPAQYSIKAEFTPSSTWERESNDEYGAATPVTLNTAYSGTLMHTYDIDWYKVSLTSAQPLSIGFTHTTATTSSAIYYEVYLLDSNRYKVKQINVPGSAKSASIDAGTMKAGTYYIVVDTYSSSAWSSAQYSVNAMTKPAKVTSFTGASAGYNSVKLSWAKASGVNGYEIYRSGTSGGTFSKIKTIESASTLTYTDSGLTTGKTYYYKVRSYRTAGTAKVYGDYTAVVPGKPVPGKPASPKAVSASYNSIKLTWATVAGATKYEVYRAASSTGTYTKLTETTSTSYTNASLTTGATYYYKVKAYRTVGSAKVYGGYSAIVPAKPVPATPAGVKAARVSSSSVKVSWSAVAGAAGYEVYRATASGGTYTLVKSVTTLNWTNTGLATGKTYYYKVRAYRTVSGKKVFGGYSAVVSAKP